MLCSACTSNSLFTMKLLKGLNYGQNISDGNPYLATIFHMMSSLPHYPMNLTVYDKE